MMNYREFFGEAQSGLSTAVQRNVRDAGISAFSGGAQKRSASKEGARDTESVQTGLLLGVIALLTNDHALSVRAGQVVRRKG